MVAAKVTDRGPRPMLYCAIAMFTDKYSGNDKAKVRILIPLLNGPGYDEPVGTLT